MANESGDSRTEAEESAGGKFVRAALSFWERVRARKVVQWSVAYLVASFALLQGLVFIADTMGWPDAVGRVGLALMLAGAPIVAIIAWHHGDRGHQRVTRIEATMIAGCVAFGAGLVVLVLQPREEEAHWRPSTLPRLAVLRFETLGETDPYFSETLADELISEATRIQGLDVVARASSFALEGDAATPAAAARELGADAVLTGSVRRVEGQLRVTAHLVEAPNGRALWSGEFERSQEEIYLLQRDIAANVARASGLRLSAPAPRRVDPRAYELYLRGRQAEQPDTPEAFHAARALYRAAVDLDPRFTAAWAGLAAASQNAAYLDWLYAPPGSVMSEPLLAEALEAANRATELDPALASPFETRTRVARWSGNWTVGLREAAEATSRGGIGHGAIYLQLGYGRRFEDMTRRAVELDPLSSLQLSNLFTACEINMRPDCMLEAAERAYRVAPDGAFNLLQYALALAETGRTREALELTHIRSDLWRQVLEINAPLDMATLRMQLGAEGEAPSLAELMAKYERGEAYLEVIIDILERSGQSDAIPPLLDHWDATMRSQIGYLFHHGLGAVHGSPQFWALMEREGIADVWRETGEWPDFCERQRAVCEQHLR